MTHIRAILASAKQVVSLVNKDKRSVLIHCSDGWDRTAQLTSLSMLMLDGYYRTLKGFLTLIEKEWISFGHKFFLRIGHGDKSESERSPVFLQFLDCTYQILQQFENAFEFNEKLLLTIADHLYSCQYGTFLLNSEKTRVDMKISEYTMSVWTDILRDSKTYINPSYRDKAHQILHIDLSIKLWKNYYYRYMPDYQSSLEIPNERASSFMNLRTKIANELKHLTPANDEISQDKSRVSYILTGTQFPANSHTDF